MSAGIPCSSSNARFQATAPAPPVDTSVPSMSGADHVVETLEEELPLTS
jgi:hypothetical protein